MMDPLFKYPGPAPVKVQLVLKYYFYLLVGDKLNLKNLLVVLESLKDRAFDSRYRLRSFVSMSLARSVVEC